MAELRDGVALTELGVITRWSLAVRQPEAERADLIAELKADLAWLEGTPVRAAQPPVTLPPPRPNDRTQEIATPVAVEQVPDDEEYGEEPDEPVVTPPRAPATGLRRLPKAPGGGSAASAGKAGRPTGSGVTKVAPSKTAPARTAPARTAPARTAPAKAGPGETAPRKRTVAKTPVAKTPVKVSKAPAKRAPRPSSGG